MMRSLLSLWLPALAAASTGQLFFYDSAKSSLQHGSIDSKTAGLVLASRVGVADFHDLGVVSDESLAVINEFGSQKRMFSHSPTRPVALLISTSPDSIDEGATHSLSVSPMPSLEHTLSFFDALSEQQTYLLESQRSRPELHAESVVSRTVSDADVVSETRRYNSLGYNVIVVLVQSEASSTSTYGSWTLPSGLHKRQLENPLDDFSFSTIDNDTISSSQKSNSSSPLRGILPACYSSKSACMSTTRNCTGHGSCKLAYTQKDSSGDSSGVPCYQCACTPSIRQNPDGSKKTTVWGGPACQKKDVTTPFWLLASFTVFMVFLISWAIGTLLTMGNEELPSVIGAGVSGPVRK